MMAKTKDPKTDAELLHGRRERMRTQFARDGLLNFTASQVLEYALGLVIPRIDTHPTAHRLLATFGSLDGVINAHPEKLQKVDGMGVSSAHFIHFLKHFVTYHLESARERTQIKTPLMAIEFLRDAMKTHSVEEFVVLALDKGGNVLLQHGVRGSLNRVNVSLRDIVDVALRVGCSSVIIAHNHVDDSVTPSAADVRLTRALVNLLAPLEIELMDHLIFCKTDAVYSLSKSGLLHILRDEHHTFSKTSPI